MPKALNKEYIVNLITFGLFEVILELINFKKVALRQYSF